MKLSLTLIAVKPYTSKATSEQMYKYIFVSPLEKIYTGFSDVLKYEDRISDSDHYDSARAHEYEVEKDSFNDKLVYKVAV